MILAIRISGMVDKERKVEETLFRMRLRRKYVAVLLKPTIQNQKLLAKVRNFVAFGDIDTETMKMLLDKRAMPAEKGKKIDAEKIVSSIETKPFKQLGIKPFFRLHPPRGGIESKKHFGVGKGVLGDNKAGINVLVRRML
jgi:large subunit ribosomal protein L30